MMKPASDIQRQPIEEEEEMLQGKPDESQLPVVAEDMEAQIDAARGSGQPLPDSVRGSLEPHFGHDFSQVRVHTDAEADKLSRQLDAEAFTTGRDVFFREGAYQPDSANGKGLIAHELTHVVQQSAVEAIQEKPVAIESQRDTLSIQMADGKKVTGGVSVLPVATGPSAEVPDLTELTVVKVKAKIKAGKKQEAINLIVSEVEASKFPRLSECTSATMRYNPAEPETGDTSYLYDPNTNTASNIRITIGNAAFDSISWLHSTMSHEYKHAVQVLTDAKKWTEKDALSEFVAWSWEIFHAHETGVIKDVDKIKELGEGLKSEGWDEMSLFEKALNAITYIKALNIVKTATGGKK
jgi:hypothetical protein